LGGYPDPGTREGALAFRGLLFPVFQVRLCLLDQDVFRLKQPDFKHLIVSGVMEQSYGVV